MAKKASSGDFGFRVTEIVFGGEGQPSKYIRLELGERTVRIHVDDTTYANFKSEFVRSNPTEKQKVRHATMMQILRDAYLTGLKEGKAS